MADALVLQSDFGVADGAVSAMYGVALSVSPTLRICDLTHEIPQFDIWEASYRLIQTVSYWPEGTVFVSVVDPGVGSARRSIVAKTANGRYVVTPDNGTLTHLARYVGIVEVREIDETVNRYPGTRGTSVFAGRDVFGYTAARLASGVISWEEVGPSYSVDDIVRLPMAEPAVADGVVSGIVDIIDPNFGNAWTNIPFSVFEEAGFAYGDLLRVCVTHAGETVLDACVPLCHSFGDVAPGELLAYTNELMNVAFTMNQSSIVERYGISYGSDWLVAFSRSAC